MVEKFVPPVSQILALTAYLTALVAALRAMGSLEPEAVDGIAAMAIGALPPEASEEGALLIEAITFRSLDFARMIDVKEH